MLACLCGQPLAEVRVTVTGAAQRLPRLELMLAVTFGDFYDGENLGGLNRPETTMAKIAWAKHAEPPPGVARFCRAGFATETRHVRLGFFERAVVAARKRGATFLDGARMSLVHHRAECGARGIIRRPAV